MFIDGKGKVFGKVSILDVIVLLIIVGLTLGVFYTKTSKQTAEIIDSEQEFYITFMVEEVRDFSVNAVKVGDIFYEQHGAILGECVETYSEPATDPIHYADGTSALVPIEDKYDLYIKVMAKGNVNEKGYFVNGNRQLSPGNEIDIQSNQMITACEVYEITE